MFIAHGVPSPRTSHDNTVPLQTSQTVAFDVNRQAVTALGPRRAGQQWHVTRLVTTAGQIGDFVRLAVYRNFASDSSIIDSTYQGAEATSETDFLLLEGEQLVCVWTNGTPNTFATINVSGDIRF